MLNNKRSSFPSTNSVIVGLQTRTRYKTIKKSIVKYLHVKGAYQPSVQSITHQFTPSREHEVSKANETSGCRWPSNKLEAELWQPWTRVTTPQPFIRLWSRKTTHADVNHTESATIEHRGSMVATRANGVGQLRKVKAKHLSSLIKIRFRIATLVK